MMKYLIKIFIFIGFIFVIPIILFSLVLVFFEDGSPLIFTQKRLGKNKKIFKIYKIRTMKKNTPSKGTHEVEKDNYLFVGSILRKTKIDELPQLLNFFRGDINLIGPRPGLDNQHELKKLRDEYNVYTVKPGITGLSQVLGYDMSNPEILAKVDSLYIKRRNIQTDFYILLATFFKYFRNKLLKIHKIEIGEINNV